MEVLLLITSTTTGYSGLWRIQMYQHIDAGTGQSGEYQVPGSLYSRSPASRIIMHIRRNLAIY